MDYNKFSLILKIYYKQIAQKCPKRGEKKEVRKTENVMGGQRYEGSRNSGRRMENNSKQSAVAQG